MCQVEKQSVRVDAGREPAAELSAREHEGLTRIGQQPESDRPEGFWRRFRILKAVVTPIFF